MNRVVTITFAVVLLVVVMAVFISPAMDLPPTALRAALWAAALFATLTVPRIARELLAPGQIRGWTRIMPGQIVQTPPLVDLNCARLC